MYVFANCPLEIISLFLHTVYIMMFLALNLPEGCYFGHPEAVACGYTSGDYQAVCHQLASACCQLKTTQSKSHSSLGLPLQTKCIYVKFKPQK